MLPIAYVVSQFPETHETFILREIQALSHTLGARPPIFSLKPCRDRVIHEEARSFLETTTYPSSGRAARALPSVFRSPEARRCLRDVLVAYRAQPQKAAKAFATLVLAAAMVPTIRQLQLRHLHAHWATMPALAAYFIKQISGIPYSLTAHAWDIYTDTTFLREKMRAAEFIVTCTAANCEALTARGARPERVFLSYHGLDFTRLPAPLFDRAPGLRILAVGRLVEQKGFAVLIKACHLLKQEAIPFHCQIIGEGRLENELRNLMSFYQLDGMVKLHGSIPQAEVFEAYRHASVFCAPSIIAEDGNRDGIPNVILEAMSQGLPVVASNVSGIPEVIHPQQTGWLTPQQDARALASAFQEIHRSPEEARRRATAAYDLVRKNFNVQENTLTLLQLFAQATRFSTTAVAPDGQSADVEQHVGL